MPAFPGVSVLVVIPEIVTSLTQTDIEKALDLSKLISTGTIITWNAVVIDLSDIVTCQSDSPSLQLESAIRHLAAASPSPPKLKHDSLHNFVTLGVSQFFIRAVSRDNKRRNDVALGEQNPDSIVALFNRVIEHLSECCAGGYLRNYSWPIAEFSHHECVPPLYWNLSERLASIQTNVLSVRLPLPSSVGWSPELDLSTECKVCRLYVKNILAGPSEMSSSALSVRIHQLLSVSEQPVGVHSDSDGFSDRRLSTVPWTCVLILLASHRVAVVTSREDLVPGGQSNNVYYEPSLYAHFEFPTQWVSSMSDSLLGAASCVRSSPGDVQQCSGGSSVVLGGESRQRLNESDEQDESSHILTASPHVVSSAQSFAARLGDSLQAAGQECDIYDRQLENWLNSGSSVITYQPHGRPGRVQETELVETKTNQSKAQHEEKLKQSLQQLRRRLDKESWLQSLEERSLKRLSTSTM
ncbi:germinal-center associated nuclear protein-like [Corticium candelabrum]|uniref:germinal-center associated nuclear protein-like n=1 Tax=Corticium candelabrum TaxID=121492 RepID=UPI002E26ABC3|nr:germinal-center associated nuclear protein-like [Corticium candelabrum]